MKDHASVKGFNRFLIQFMKDVKQWAFFMLYLLAFRIVFIFYFRNKLDAATGVTDIVKTVLNGLRYDSMVSTYWTLIPFLASAASGFINREQVPEKVRSGAGTVFIFLTSIAWVVTFGYFNEYNEQFNYFIFNLYYDDAAAIFKTIWADYHPLIYLVIISALFFTAATVRKKDAAEPYPAAG